MGKRYLNRIKEVLKMKGRSQLWLAGEIGVTTNTISSFCKNDSQPRLDTLHEIAEVLDMGVYDLILPNKKSKMYMNNLHMPTSKAEAELLNKMLHAMVRNSHSTNITFAYHNRAVDGVVGKDMFNYLASILEQDNLVQGSPTGIHFTIKGYILVKDFSDKEVSSQNHIGYEKVWYSSLPSLN